MPVRTDDKGHQQYAVAWVAKTSALRRDIPQSVGSSSSTSTAERWHQLRLHPRRSLRSNKSLSPEVERYRKDYCVSDAFLAQLDERAATACSTSDDQERRINYVLKTGANWAGPIRSFKLTIECGAGDRLVSFCPGRLKPTAPNALEIYRQRTSRPRAT